MRRNNFSWDNFQERVFLENQLDRRIQFFLIFIVISVVVSLFIPVKEIALMFLILFVIISWLLVVSIYNTYSKLKSIEKEIGKTATLKDKLIRFTYSLILPIFSALLLTIFLLLIASGSIDSILPYKIKANEIAKETTKKVEEVVSQKIKPQKDVSKYFKSVDSIALENKDNVVMVDSSLLKVGQQKQSSKKKDIKSKIDPNFKSIEKVIND